MHKTALIALTVMTAGSCLGACPQYDFTGDCWVDFDDFALFASEWLTGSRNTVPYVIGMPQTSAERAIIAAGLTVGEVTVQYSEAIAAGNVVSQEPAAEEMVAAGKDVAIVVSIGLSRLFPDLIWTLIDDSGTGMVDEGGDPISHGGFTGYMSKYETTNAQYCKYLNQALAAGKIEVGDDDYVRGATSGDPYYYLAGSGISADGAINGGAARINYNSNAIGDKFRVDSGFEHHPVSQVSWHGATAFSDYYGWRLPTEWEWQAVADYDGSWEWGCGTVIHNGMANYKGSSHPDGTTIRGSFGSYGYGVCDMAGNVEEWTSSEYTFSTRTIRDGYWGMLAYYCRVVQRPHAVPSLCSYSIGFRPVMDVP